MDIFIQLLEQSGVANLSLGNLLMFVIAGILIYLAITKEYEPLLLIPIGFGAILANLPLADMASEGEGLIAVIYDAGNLVLDFDPIKKSYLDSQSRGMLWQVEFSKAGVHRLEGTPLTLRFLRTHVANGERRDIVLDHVVKYSKEFGTALRLEEGRIYIDVDPGEVLQPTEEAKAPLRPRRTEVRRRRRIHCTRGCPRERSRWTFGMPTASA